MEYHVQYVAKMFARFMDANTVANALERHIVQKIKTPLRNHVNHAFGAIDHRQNCPMCGCSEKDRRDSEGNAYLHRCHVGCSFKFVSESAAKFIVQKRSKDIKNGVDVDALIEEAYELAKCMHKNVPMQVACHRCNPYLEDMSMGDVQQYRTKGTRAFRTHMKFLDGQSTKNLTPGKITSHFRVSVCAPVACSDPNDCRQAPSDSEEGSDESSEEESEEESDESDESSEEESEEESEDNEDLPPKEFMKKTIEFCSGTAFHKHHPKAKDQAWLVKRLQKEAMRVRSTKKLKRIYRAVYHRYPSGRSANYNPWIRNRILIVNRKRKRESNE